MSDTARSIASERRRIRVPSRRGPCALTKSAMPIYVSYYVSACNTALERLLALSWPRSFVHLPRGRGLCPHCGQPRAARPAHLLQVRLDEPQVLVHLARHAGEQVGGVLVARIVA